MEKVVQEENRREESHKDGSKVETKDIGRDHHRPVMDQNQDFRLGIDPETTEKSKGQNEEALYAGQQVSSESFQNLCSNTPGSKIGLKSPSNAGIVGSESSGGVGGFSYNLNFQENVHFNRAVKITKKMDFRNFGASEQQTTPSQLKRRTKKTGLGDIGLDGAYQSLDGKLGVQEFDEQFKHGFSLAEPLVEVIKVQKRLVFTQDVDISRNIDFCTNPEETVFQKQSTTQSRLTIQTLVSSSLTGSQSIQDNSKNSQKLKTDSNSKTKEKMSSGASKISSEAPNNIRNQVGILGAPSMLQSKISPQKLIKKHSTHTGFPELTGNEFTSSLDSIFNRINNSNLNFIEEKVSTNQSQLCSSKPSLAPNQQESSDQDQIGSELLVSGQAGLLMSSMIQGSDENNEASGGKVGLRGEGSNEKDNQFGIESISEISPNQKTDQKSENEQNRRTLEKQKENSVVLKSASNPRKNQKGDELREDHSQEPEAGNLARGDREGVSEDDQESVSAQHINSSQKIKFYQTKSESIQSEEVRDAGTPLQQGSLQPRDSQGTPTTRPLSTDRRHRREFEEVTQTSIYFESVNSDIDFCSSAKKLKMDSATKNTRNGRFPYEDRYPLSDVNVEKHPLKESTFEQTFGGYFGPFDPISQKNDVLDDKGVSLFDGKAGSDPDHNFGLFERRRGDVTTCGQNSPQSSFVDNQAFQLNIRQSENPLKRQALLNHQDYDPKSAKIDLSDFGGSQKEIDGKGYQNKEIGGKEGLDTLERLSESDIDKENAGDTFNSEIKIKPERAPFGQRQARKAISRSALTSTTQKMTQTSLDSQETSNEDQFGLQTLFGQKANNFEGDDQNTQFHELRVQNQGINSNMRFDNQKQDGAIRIIHYDNISNEKIRIRQHRTRDGLSPEHSSQNYPSPSSNPKTPRITIIAQNQVTGPQKVIQDSQNTPPFPRNNQIPTITEYDHYTINSSPSQDTSPHIHHQPSNNHNQVLQPPEYNHQSFRSPVTQNRRREYSSNEYFLRRSLSEIAEISAELLEDELSSCKKSGRGSSYYWMNSERRTLKAGGNEALDYSQGGGGVNYDFSKSLRKINQQVFGGSPDGVRVGVELESGGNLAKEVTMGGIESGFVSPEDRGALLAKAKSDGVGGMEKASMGDLKVEQVEEMKERCSDWAGEKSGKERIDRIFVSSFGGNLKTEENTSEEKPTLGETGSQNNSRGRLDQPAPSRIADLENLPEKQTVDQNDWKIDQKVLKDQKKASRLVQNNKRERTDAGSKLADQKTGNQNSKELKSVEVSSIPQLESTQPKNLILGRTQMASSEVLKPSPITKTPKHINKKQKIETEAEREPKIYPKSRMLQKSSINAPSFTSNTQNKGDQLKKLKNDTKNKNAVDKTSRQKFSKKIKAMLLPDYEASTTQNKSSRNIKKARSTNNRLQGQTGFSNLSKSVKSRPSQQSFEQHKSRLSQFMEYQKEQKEAKSRQYFSLKSDQSFQSTQLLGKNSASSRWDSRERKSNHQSHLSQGAPNNNPRPSTNRISSRIGSYRGFSSSAGDEITEQAPASCTVSNLARETTGLGFERLSQVSRKKLALKAYTQSFYQKKATGMDGGRQGPQKLRHQASFSLSGLRDSKKSSSRNKPFQLGGSLPRSSKHSGSSLSTSRSRLGGSTARTNYQMLEKHINQQRSPNLFKDFKDKQISLKSTTKRHQGHKTHSRGYRFTKELLTLTEPGENRSKDKETGKRYTRQLEGQKSTKKHYFFKKTSKPTTLVIKGGSEESGEASSSLGPLQRHLQLTSSRLSSGNRNHSNYSRRGLLGTSNSSFKAGNYLSSSHLNSSGVNPFSLATSRSGNKRSWMRPNEKQALRNRAEGSSTNRAAHSELRKQNKRSFSGAGMWTERRNFGQKMASKPTLVSTKASHGVSAGSKHIRSHSSLLKMVKQSNSNKNHIDVFSAQRRKQKDISGKGAGLGIRDSSGTDIKSLIKDILFENQSRVKGKVLGEERGPERLFVDSGEKADNKSEEKELFKAKRAITTQLSNLRNRINNIPSTAFFKKNSARVEVEMEEGDEMSRENSKTVIKFSKKGEETRGGDLSRSGLFEGIERFGGHNVSKRLDLDTNGLDEASYRSKSTRFGDTLRNRFRKGLGWEEGSDRNEGDRSSPKAEFSSKTYQNHSVDSFLEHRGSMGREQDPVNAQDTQQDDEQVLKRISRNLSFFCKAGSKIYSNGPLDELSQLKASRKDLFYHEESEDESNNVYKQTFGMELGHDAEEDEKGSVSPLELRKIREKISQFARVNQTPENRFSDEAEELKVRSKKSYSIHNRVPQADPVDSHGIQSFLITDPGAQIASQTPEFKHIEGLAIDPINGYQASKMTNLTDVYLNDANNRDNYGNKSYSHHPKNSLLEDKFRSQKLVSLGRKELVGGLPTTQTASREISGLRRYSRSMHQSVRNSDKENTKKLLNHAREHHEIDSEPFRQNSDDLGGQGGSRTFFGFFADSHKNSQIYKESTKNRDFRSEDEGDKRPFWGLHTQEVESEYQIGGRARLPGNPDFGSNSARKQRKTKEKNVMPQNRGNGNQEEDFLSSEVEIQKIALNGDFGLNDWNSDQRESGRVEANHRRPRLAPRSGESSLARDNALNHFLNQSFNSRWRKAEGGALISHGRLGNADYDESYLGIVAEGVKSRISNFRKNPNFSKNSPTEGCRNAFKGVGGLKGVQEGLEQRSKSSKLSKIYHMKKGQKSKEKGVQESNNLFSEPSRRQVKARSRLWTVRDQKTSQDLKRDFEAYLCLQSQKLTPTNTRQNRRGKSKPIHSKSRKKSSNRSKGKKSKSRTRKPKKSKEKQTKHLFGKPGAKSENRRNPKLNKTGFRVNFFEKAISRTKGVNQASRSYDGELRGGFLTKGFQEGFGLGSDRGRTNHKKNKSKTRIKSKISLERNPSQPRDFQRGKFLSFCLQNSKNVKGSKKSNKSNRLGFGAKLEDIQLSKPTKKRSHRRGRAVYGHVSRSFEKCEKSRKMGSQTNYLFKADSGGDQDEQEDILDDPDYSTDPYEQDYLDFSNKKEKRWIGNNSDQGSPSKTVVTALRWIPQKGDEEEICSPQLRLRRPSSFWGAREANTQIQGYQTDREYQEGDEVVSGILESQGGIGNGELMPKSAIKSKSVRMKSRQFSRNSPCSSAKKPTRDKVKTVLDKLAEVRRLNEDKKSKSQQYWLKRAENKKEEFIDKKIKKRTNLGKNSTLESEVAVLQSPITPLKQKNHKKAKTSRRVQNSNKKSSPSPRKASAWVRRAPPRQKRQKMAKEVENQERSKKLTQTSRTFFKTPQISDSYFYVAKKRRYASNRSRNLSEVPESFKSPQNTYEEKWKNNQNRVSESYFGAREETKGFRKNLKSKPMSNFDRIFGQKEKISNLGKNGVLSKAGRLDWRQRPLLGSEAGSKTSRSESDGLNLIRSHLFREKPKKAIGDPRQKSSRTELLSKLSRLSKKQGNSLSIGGEQTAAFALTQSKKSFFKQYSPKYGFKRPQKTNKLSSKARYSRGGEDDLLGIGDKEVAVSRCEGAKQRDSRALTQHRTIVNNNRNQGEDMSSFDDYEHQFNTDGINNQTQRDIYDQSQEDQDETQKCRNGHRYDGRKHAEPEIRLVSFRGETGNRAESTGVNKTAEILNLNLAEFYKRLKRSPISPTYQLTSSSPTAQPIKTTKMSTQHEGPAS